MNIDLQVQFEFAEDLHACISRKQVTSLCGKYTSEMGFEHFLVGVYFPKVGEIQTLSGYPEEWLEHYNDMGYVYRDPVVKHCLLNIDPIEWPNLKLTKGVVGEAEREVMEEAASCGLINGISVPIHGAGAESGMLSFATTDGNHKPDQSMHFALQFMTQFVHQSLKRVINKEPNSSPAANKLTEREKECLRWTANGKTAWEISRILNLSESTITFHLKNSISKMQVTNRPQAVAKAVAESLITLF